MDARAQLGRFSFGLSREAWVVQVGVFLNMLGYGAVLPFEIIYLHSARHFSLAVAGLVIATVTGTAIVASFPAGSLIDYIGPRDSAVAGLVLLAAGYGGLAFAGSVWPAFACAAVAGCGNGVVTPGQSALVAAIVPRELRHRATAVSRVSVNVGFAGGAGLGGIVATAGNNGLRALFLVNAATYLAYALLLRAAVHVAAAARRDSLPGSYRRVFADRPFVTVAVAHVGFIAVGWGVFSWVVPFYAQRVGVNRVLVGGLLLVNGLTVVVAQLPIAKRMEGTRRSRSIALAGSAFVLACTAALVAQVRFLAAAVLILAAVLVALGECLYIAAFTPLVADLAPPEMLGRYMSCAGVAWSLGLAAGPALFTPLVGVSALACFLGAAAVVVAATVAVLLNEKRLPAAAQITQVVSRAA